jgi:hypothetical protein
MSEKLYGTQKNIIFRLEQPTIGARFNYITTPDEVCQVLLAVKIFRLSKPEF